MKYIVACLHYCAMIVAEGRFYFVSVKDVFHCSSVKEYFAEIIMWLGLFLWSCFSISLSVELQYKYPLVEANSVVFSCCSCRHLIWMRHTVPWKILVMELQWHRPSPKC